MSEINQVIKHFVSLLEERLFTEISALYIRGSYARGDWVQGLSDLDFYLIIKDQILKEEGLRSKILKKLQTIAEEARKTSSTTVISCEYTSDVKVRETRMQEVESFITSQDSQLLYGQDLLREIPVPNLNELKEYGRMMIASAFDHWVTTEKQWRPHKREIIVYNMQRMILKLAQNGLFAKGILKFKKEDIVNTFLTEFRDFQQKKMVEEAYQIRQKWGSVRHDKVLLSRFIKEGRRFPQAFKKYLNEIWTI